MLSRDNCMPFDTWNLSGTQGNVVGDPGPVFDSSQTPYPGILLSTTPCATGANPVQASTGRPVARGEEQIASTTTVPQEGRQPWIPLCQRKFHRNLWLDSKDHRYRSFSSTNCPHLQRLFFCWKIKFKNQVTTCSDFCFWSDVMDQGSGDGRGWIKILAINCRWGFPNFEMLDARVADALNKIIQYSHFQKKVSLEKQKAQKRGPVSTRKTDRLHDLRLLSSRRRSRYRSWLRWSIHNYSSQWRRSGIRYVMGWNLVICDQDPVGWCSGKPVQINDTWVWSTKNYIRIAGHGNSSEEIDARVSKIETNGEEKCRSQTQIAKLWRQTWENWHRSSG